MQQQLWLRHGDQFGCDVLERGCDVLQRGGHGVKRGSHQRGSFKLGDGVIESGCELVKRFEQRAGS